MNTKVRITESVSSRTTISTRFISHWVKFAESFLGAWNLRYFIAAPIIYNQESELFWACSLASITSIMFKGGINSVYSMNLLYAKQQVLIAVYSAVIQNRLEEHLNHKIYSESSKFSNSKIKSSTDTGLHTIPAIPVRYLRQMLFQHKPRKPSL